MNSITPLASEIKNETIKIPSQIRSEKKVRMRYFLLFTTQIGIGSICSFLIVSRMFFLRDILEMIMDRRKASLELFFGSVYECTDSAYGNSQDITDLFIVSSFDILEDDDFSLLRRE